MQILLHAWAVIGGDYVAIELDSDASFETSITVSIYCSRDTMILKKRHHVLLIRVKY